MKGRQVHPNVHVELLGKNAALVAKFTMSFICVLTWDCSGYQHSHPLCAAESGKTVWRGGSAAGSDPFCNRLDVQSQSTQAPLKPRPVQGHSKLILHPMGTRIPHGW